MNNETVDKIIDQILANPQGFANVTQNWSGSIVSTRPSCEYYYMDIAPKSGRGITIVFGSGNSVRFGRTNLKDPTTHYVSRQTYMYESGWTVAGYRTEDIKKIIELMAAQEINEYNERLAREKEEFNKAWGL